jgi:hypothetical protein
MGKFGFMNKDMIIRSINRGLFCGEWRFGPKMESVVTITLFLDDTQDTIV